MGVAKPAGGIKVRIELFISFHSSTQLQILVHFLNNRVVSCWFLGEMSEHHRLDDGMRWRIVGRIEAGQSQAQVARELDITPSVISNLWSQFKTSGTVCRRPGQGRPRASTANDDRYLVVSAKRQRTATPTQLSRDLAAATGTSISSKTVSRRLHERGLYARKPAICIPLTPSHKRARAEWCRQHQNWTQLQWANVLFTDESRFSLQPDSGRLLIWREPGTRYHSSNIIERDHYAGGGLMVWAGIMQDTRTPLHVFDKGSVNGQRYRQEVLEPHVRLFRGAVGPEFIFMDDNARPHRTLMVDEYLESEDIQRMDWPSKSPDLNPIEHAWDALGRAIAMRQPPPRTILELKIALVEEWEGLPQPLLNSLINSMHTRCACCLSVRGDHTPY